MLNRFGRAAGLAAGLCLTLASTAALADGFATERHAVWVGEMQALVAATHGEAEDMAASCTGFGGMVPSGDVKKEYFQVPKWAFMARFRTCGAFRTIATNGKGFMHRNAGDVCKGMKMAI